MDVYALVEKLGGEIVRSNARVRQGADYVVIGKLNGDNMEFTEAGRRLAAAEALQPVTKAKRAKAAKADKSDKAVVESDEFDAVINDDDSVFDEDQGLT